MIKIIFQYPPDKPLENPECIKEFCFPDGVKASSIPRTQSLSAQNEILFGSLSLLEASQSSYIILLTTEKSLIYGICVVTSTILDQPPSFFGAPMGAPTRSRYDIVVPMCYCLLSKYPLFQLHFDFLYSLIGRERLYNLERMSTDAIIDPGKVQL